MARKTGGEWLLMFLAIFALFLGVCVVLGVPVMLLWNWLMPDIFGLREISFWEAVGISILFNLLTGTSTASSK